MMPKQEMESEAKTPISSKKEEMSPLDSAIEKVESYIDDPELATKETLMALYEDLMVVKNEMEGGEEDEMEEGEEMKSKPLSIIIGMARRKT